MSKVNEILQDQMEQQVESQNESTGPQVSNCVISLF